MRLNVAEILEVTGGELLAGTTTTEVTSVSIDSRLAQPGSLFVAIVAERDGNDFVSRAFAGGAVAALVTRASEGTGARGAVVRVADTREAIYKLGGYARSKVSVATVVGITGSAGKTSTKDLTAAALTARRVHASESSFNNEIGVPLTLLAAEVDSEVVIVEMGARRIGDLAHLGAIAQPDIGVVTNIGMAHVGVLGGMEQTVEAKGELIECLPSEGVAILNADDVNTPALATRSSARILRFGIGDAGGADVQAHAIELDSELRPRFRIETPWGRSEVALSVRGAHQVMNAVAATAVAGALGEPLDRIVGGLATATGSGHRLDMLRTEGGVMVLDDTYNANPASVIAAIEALAATGVSGNRWAVLGVMAELGDHTGEEHRKVGRAVARLGIQNLVVVGTDASDIAEGARGTGVDVMEVPDTDAALEVLAARLRPGDAVLVKASRAARLENVTDGLVRKGRSA